MLNFADGKSKEMFMKNTFGSSLSVTLFGESHGNAVGAVIDGIAPGIPVDMDYIMMRMEERRPSGSISTARKESDLPRIISGVFKGRTTGTPITLVIENENTKSRDYESISDIPRPSHADYTAECKYHGFQDHRGGGHFSGRVTAALVAAAAIIRAALETKGILIGTHIARLKSIEDRGFLNYAEDISLLTGAHFPTLSSKAGEEMQSLILSVKEEGDSVGGVLESVIIGVPEGVGEPWFDTVEGVLAHALFSVPALKGVEFGAGFRLADMLGSEANDPFVKEGDKILTSTNNNGGINGGITNGMPIIFRSVIKPTPSIFKPQGSVSLKSGKATKMTISGRHDPAIIHRARAVVDAVSAIAIADLLCQRYGTDYLAPDEN